MWVVLVVGLSVETAAVNTLVLKSLLNAIYTVVTKLDVDSIVTSVVVGPTSELVSVALVVYYVRYSVYNLHLERSDVRLASWEVNSCERSVANDVVVYNSLGALVVADEVVQTVDLGVGVSKLSVESVDL